MIEITPLFLVLLLGIITGFFDSVVGAGGLISVPSLIILGLPPQMAIATDRFGTIGQTLAALFKFWKAKKIVWKFVPILSMIGLVGSLIGASLLVNAESKMLETVVGIVMLILLPLLFWKREIGILSTKTSKSRNVIGFVIYLGIMIFGAFFGQGTGPMIVYVLTFFFGVTMIEALATGVVPWLVLSLSSVVIFALNGIIDYEKGIVLLMGMAVGGYIGAHVAVKKCDMWVKHLFIVFVIILGVKLLFF